MKLSEALALYNALLLLDGYVVLDANKNAVRVPYDFGEASHKVRWNITKNLRKLKPHFEDWEKVRTELIKEISGGNSIDTSNKEQMQTFSTKTEELLKQEIVIEGLLKITEEQLNLAKNPIPNKNCLEDLWIIMDGN